MDKVVIDFKSGDTFYCHRYTDCNASILDDKILKIELEEAIIYYPLMCLSNVTIIQDDEEDNT